jgi:hypothetical protein
MKTTTLPLKDSMNRSSRPLGLLLIPLALVCFALSSTARADNCEQGCDFLFRNTFLGQQALINNTGGLDNTAIGFYSLNSNTTGLNNTAIGSGTLTANTGGYNTGIGAGALNSNTTGIYNTANGASALAFNTIGSRNVATGASALYSNQTGIDNTATGVNALLSNTTGNNNTANGAFALNSNTTGVSNTANGWQALFGNTTGNNNTANGLDALLSNTTGINNTANGVFALGFNTTGSSNTATGISALQNNTIGANNTATGQSALQNNTTGPNNTAVGFNALQNNTIGSSNVGLGVSAGTNLTTGSNNIDIGNAGVAGESRTIRVGTKPTHKNAYIAGISGVTVPTGVPVIVDANGHLGTTTSSARFKDAIKPMDKASEAILALKPVTFHYKEEIDPAGIPQFGLVAEQVEKVNPELVARDEHGKPYTVRYEAVNAMLLNEFLKEHQKVQRLEAALAAVNERLKAQDAKIDKVNAKVELTKPAPQMVVNDQ